MFSISMLLTQLLIGRFWYYDDYDYADYDDDDYDQNDYFVYIFIFIIFITCNMFSGMELWEVWYYVSFWGKLQLSQVDL